MKPWVLYSSLASLVFLGACTEDAGAPPTEPATPDASPSGPVFEDLELYDIVVRVTFPSPGEAALNVGAFRSYPPMGPPLSNFRDESPASPAELNLRDLEPGTYVLVGILDLPPTSPTLPGEEDRVTYTEAFEVIDRDLSLNLDFESP